MLKEQIIKNQDARPASNRLPEQPSAQTGNPLITIAGFTLVELLMVVALIGILATLSVPTYNAFIDRAKNGRAKSEVRLLETEINAYRFDTNSLPASLAAINRDGMLDPWGEAYVYHLIVPPSELDPISRKRFGNPLNSDFDLCSKGKDGSTPANGSLEDAGLDDLVRGMSGIFVGSGADF